MAYRAGLSLRWGPVVHKEVHIGLDLSSTGDTGFVLNDKILGLEKWGWNTLLWYCLHLRVHVPSCQRHDYGGYRSCKCDKYDGLTKYDKYDRSDKYGKSYFHVDDTSRYNAYNK